MKRPVLLALGLLVPLAASAHPGHAGDHDFEWGFSSGVQHPLFGFDHLLAMIAVGWWAVQLGGRARWLVPAAFLAAMTLGAALTRTGLSLPGVEPMIAASVVTLGVLIARGTKLSVAAGALVVGSFAVFHGAAHAVEFSGAAGIGAYAAGFLVSTLALHLVGAVLATVAARQESMRSSRSIGWLVAASGLVMLVS